MLGAQPPLSVGLCPIGTSTSELEWALAMRAISSRLFVSARLWDMYPGIWGSSGTFIGMQVLGNMGQDAHPKNAGSYL